MFIDYPGRTTDDIERFSLQMRLLQQQSVRVADVVSVEVRKARFRAEAFHGPDTEIVVVTAERSVTEFCVPPEEIDEVALRLDAAADDPTAEPD